MKTLLCATALSLFPSVSFSAWTSIGSLGTFSQGVSTAAWTVLTTADLDAGNVGICIWASDNDGNGTNTDDFTTMTSDPSIEWTSSLSGGTAENEIDPGANNAGAVVGIFLAVATITLPSGSRLTINNATAETARAGTCWEFDVSDNAFLSGGINPLGDDGGADASTMTVVLGSANTEYLYLRGIASETTNGDIGTLTSDFTKITSATFNSGTEATSMGVVGEFIIFTSPQIGSDPTMSDTSADRASVYMRILEIGLPFSSEHDAIIID